MRRAAAVALAAASLAALATARAARRDPKLLIRAAEPAVVMVLVADMIGGELTARASGSGTVITPDGAVLTAAHVLDDEAAGRPHDLFVIGRFRGEDGEPELVCAGRPSAAKRLDAADLALIACDRDLNGQPWAAAPWPTVPLGRSERVTPGAQIWVLGYGGLGGARMHPSAGLVSGWSGEHGGAGRRDFMRTDATVAPGSSGGAAIDEAGHLIGIATAYRSLTAERGATRVPVGQVGLIRPVELARDLIAAAQAGFVPVRNDPTVPGAGAVQDGAPAAVLVRGRVLDAANRRPISGARVLFFRGSREPTSADAAIAVGATDDDGRFLSDRALARGGPYAVAIVARGYRPMFAGQAFDVAPDAPPVFEPWPDLGLVRDPAGPGTF